MISFTGGTEHFRDTFFNTVCIGRAFELLRRDVYEQLEEIQKEMHFRYLRCHALFHDEMAVAVRRPDGSLRFQWHLIDKFIDNMLKLGLRPFFELGFMPKCMAREEDAFVFAYGMLASPPKEWEEWYLLCREFTSHCVDRYGLDEVRNWYFEVWNEPNLGGFWHGTKEEYYTLYENAARAVKDVDSGIKVGGPATAGFAWISDTINYCADNNVPIDFISTHIYPIGEYCEYPNREGSPFLPGEHMPTMVHKTYEEVRSSRMSDLEIHWTEWNTQYGTPGVKVNWTHNPTVDMHFSAASIMKNLIPTRNDYDSMAYWTLTDVFEESGCAHSPFSCTYGLVNIQGIHKASYNAYKFLRKLRGTVMVKNSGDIPFGCDGFACEENGIVRGILWNWKAMEIDNQPEWSDTAEFCIPDGEYICTTATIRKHKGSPYETWISMGSPHNLSKFQQEMLEACSVPDYDFQTICVQDGKASLDFTLSPNEVMYFECEKKSQPIMPRGASAEDIERWNQIMMIEKQK